MARIGILVVAYNAQSTLRDVIRRIPAPVMEKEVKATYQDGLLVLHLPKVVPAVANRILIK